jgi:hypothetical protein
MSKQTMCADNLFLLGELLQSAGEYVTRSRNHAGDEDEDRFMIQLAREQIPHLRLTLRNLERSLAELDLLLKKRSGGDGQADEPPIKAERRARKASSGG